MRVAPFVAHTVFTSRGKTERGVLMKQNSISRADNIIYLDRFRKNAWGKYAELHQAFLKRYHPSFYNKLLALGRLDEWLRTIDEIADRADRRFEIGKKVGYSQDEIENNLFTEVIYNLR